MKELIFIIPFVLIQTIAGEAGIELYPSITNKRLVVKDGESFGVTCQMTSDTPNRNDAVIKWFDKNDEEVTNVFSSFNPHIRDGVGYKKVGFRTVKEVDSGRYTCKATVNGLEYTDYFNLEIQASLKVLECDREQNGLLGSSHAIKCVASADGYEVMATWEFKNNLIGISDKYRYNSTHLIILNVTEADEGIYTYIAEMIGRTDMEIVPVKFRVVGKPKFTSPILERTAVVGHKVELFCQATGRPLPSKIEWKKEGSSLPIVGTDRITIKDGVTDENGVQKILTIDNVVREDQGKYTCTAYGEKVYGKDLTAKTNITLIVQIPPSVDLPQPPKGVEGKGAKISCVGHGDPAPRMVWQIEGTNIQYFKGEHGDNIQVTESIITDDPNNKRVIFDISFAKVKAEDAGTYICQAVNKAGNASQKTEFVVEYGPKFIEPLAKFYTWKPKNGEAETKTELRCKVKSNPTPFFEWKKDGKVIADSTPFYGISQEKDKDDEYIVTGILTVNFNGQNSAVLGTYTCGAINNVNRSEAKMEVAQAVNPSKPTVQINLKEATTYIFWLFESPVEGPPVENYKVVYSKTASPDEFLTQTVPKEIRPIIDQQRRYTELRIENLAENTQYTFTFFAVSPVGESIGAELRETTPAVRAPGIPEIITPANADGSTLILVRWKKPSTGGSEILKYSLKYQRVTVKQQAPSAEIQSSGYELLSTIDKENTIDNIVHEQYELRNLIPGNYYMINVIAHNIKGGGTPGSKIIKTLEGITITKEDITTALNKIITIKTKKDITTVTNKAITVTLKEITNTKVDLGVTKVTITQDKPQGRVTGNDDGLSTGAIIGIVIVIFIILLVIVDVTCYLKNNCGILMSIKEKVTGSRGDDGYSAAKTDDVENLAKKDELTEVQEAKAAEEGEVAEEEKKEPLLSEEQKVDTVDEGVTEPEKKEIEPEEKEAMKQQEETKPEQPSEPEKTEEAPATEEKPPTENATDAKPAE